MKTKSHILGLESNSENILHIFQSTYKRRLKNTLEKEILAFLANLGHSGEIRKITDVNVNKLHQPWRSFAAIINKCLSGKPSYDSLRLSQAQILWGMYNKKKVDYAYLLWEDFIYQIENKNTKKGNAMYYPRFTKLVVNFVMDKDPSIPRRNKVNWHYARDDPMFTTINVISRNEDTQLYGTILPVALTNEDIRNSESYKGKKKEKKSGKGKQKTTELENISEADLTKAEQLKIITKRSRQETHDSMAPSVLNEHRDEDATYEEDRGNEAVEDTNTNLEGRDDVMTDVILPQLSVSSGFVSKANPNQDTGVVYFLSNNLKLPSLTDNKTVTPLLKPSFSVPTNHPPTPNLSRPFITTNHQSDTVPSSSHHNLPNVARLFGFDYQTSNR
ncbi:hypothetical protein Tco_0575600 [Tanacetum coccineum]